MGKHLARTLAVATLVAAAIGVLGTPAGAAGGPTSTPSFPVSSRRGIDAPRLASNGTDTLAVWQDEHGQNGTADVYGALIDPGRSVIGTPFRISLTAQEEFAPDVAWNGSSWLVVWEALTGTGERVVRGRRVSKAGALLGSQLAISPTSGERELPSVAAGPNGQFFVAWEDGRNDATTSTDVYGRRVGSAGQLLDGSGVRVSYDTKDFFPSSDRTPDVAWNGRIYLVAFEAYSIVQDVSGIEAGGVTSGGQFDYVGFIGGGTLSSGDHNYDATVPAVAVSGRTFLIVWQEELATKSGQTDIIGARTDGNGGTPNAFTVSGAAGDQTDPAVAFNGHFLVVWAEENAVRGTRVEPNGTVDDPGGFTVASGEQNSFPAISRRNSTTQTFTVAWEAVQSNQEVGVWAASLGPAPK